MANNSQKFDSGTLNKQAAIAQAFDAIHNLGKELPVSVVSVDKTNAIMTVKFETGGKYTLPNVTVPLDGPEYIRYPIKKGDKGVVRAGSVNISNMDALGTTDNPPSFTWPGNLGALIFHPIGNAKWSETDDQSAVLGYGPNGTIHRDTDKKSIHTVNPDSGVTTQTGKKESGGSVSYNMTETLDPSKGWKANVKNDSNGTSNAAIDPSSGWLASVFDGQSKHTIDSSGHTLKSSSQVKLDAPQTNVTQNLAVGSLLTAASAQFGSVAGSGGGGLSLPSGSSASGNFSVGALTASSGAVTGPVLKTNTTYTVAALIAAYPPASNQGMRATVTDATSTTFYATLTTGGGTRVVPAFCNGTNWVIA